MINQSLKDTNLCSGMLLLCVRFGSKQLFATMLARKKTPTRFPGFKTSVSEIHAYIEMNRMQFVGLTPLKFSI